MTALGFCFFVFSDHLLQPGYTRRPALHLHWHRRPLLKLLQLFLGMQWLPGGQQGQWKCNATTKPVTCAGLATVQLKRRNCVDVGDCRTVLFFFYFPKMRGMRQKSQFNNMLSVSKTMWFLNFQEVAILCKVARTLVDHKWLAQLWIY